MIIHIIQFLQLAKICLRDFVKFYYWKFLVNGGSNSLKSNEIRLSWERHSYCSISAVVFSKDRAIQLYALLSSFFDTKIGECEIVILYKYTNAAHKKAYDDISQIFGDTVKFYNQESYSSFQDSLKLVVSQLPKGNIFFLVDDIVFTEIVDYRFLASLDLSDTIFSLRMGDHLNYSYAVDASQALPKTLEFTDGYLTWQWSEGRLDWGYPLSVDGHVFSTSEVLLWIKYLDFGSPSSFENALQKLKYLYRHKRGLSFKKSRIVNIPANKVQDEIDNFKGSFHQDDLLQKWIDGMVIDHTKFRGWCNHSVHQESDFHFIKREVK